MIGSSKSFPIKVCIIHFLLTCLNFLPIMIVHLSFLFGNGRLFFVLCKFWGHAARSLSRSLSCAGMVRLRHSECDASYCIRFNWIYFLKLCTSKHSLTSARRFLVSPCGTLTLPINKSLG